MARRRKKIEGTIKMLCRECKRTATRPRAQYEPDDAVLYETVCPKCQPEGWRRIKWINADGKQVHSRVKVANQ